MTAIAPTSASAIGVCCRAPPRYAAQCCRSNATPNGGDAGSSTRAATTAASIGSTYAQKIATPPPNGIGLRWILRCPGLSTNPIRGATCFITSVPTHAMAKLTKARLRIAGIMRGGEGTRGGVEKEGSAADRLPMLAFVAPPAGHRAEYRKQEDREDARRDPGDY